ncbi:MAG TPA: iron-sulfur cluster assembly scaffold protein [Alphaproteobacteria bacterium]|nr:iron-sulfur cluster assembly scaffold protein [Alphaproteobacteria bacterium]
MSEAEKIKALYNARIMELADDIPLQGRLDRADASASVRSPLCGSRIIVDLKVDNGTVTDYRHSVRACTLGQAAASIMARHVVGKSVDELRHVGAAMRAMLKKKEPLPDDVWEDLAVLTPVQDFKSRHGSVLLSFDAVEKALKAMDV